MTAARREAIELLERVPDNHFTDILHRFDVNRIADFTS